MLVFDFVTKTARTELLQHSLQHNALSLSDHCGMTEHQPIQEEPRRKPLLTINDVAAFLVVSRDTVYRLVHSGALPHVLVGERIRFRPEDIDAYLDRD